MSEFNQYIQNVDFEFWRDLCVSEGELCIYNKGEYFIEAGTVGRHIGYIKSGTLKYTAIDESGDEHVINLEFAGESVADCENSIHGIPSRISIIVDSPTEIYRVPVSRLRERMAADRDFALSVAQAGEILFRQTYDTLIDIYCKSPKQRYKELISSHRHVFEQFQLKDIASLLRITPSHLSRLRKEIGNENQPT